MFRSVNSIKGYALYAKDGKIGSLKSLHFDDKDWRIRYLVVNIGSFFDNKDVLILPTAAYELKWVNQNIKVNLTQEQIKNALPFNSDLPVSIQHEIVDAKNYQTLYLADPWSGSFFPMWFPNVDRVTEMIDSIGDEDLRSTNVVDDYLVVCNNFEKAGKVKDFILDDEEWKIRHLVIDTNGILPFGDVLLSTQHVEGFRTREKEILIDIDAKALEHCPKYNPNEAINRAYVMKHYDYEGRLAYSSRENVQEYKELDSKLQGSN